MLDFVAGPLLDRDNELKKKFFVSFFVVHASEGANELSIKYNRPARSGDPVPPLYL